jgi:hypothetical protein
MGILIRRVSTPFTLLHRVHFFRLGGIRYVFDGTEGRRSLNLGKDIPNKREKV